MAIQLIIFERRDNTDRAELGIAALNMCRATRKLEGITSSRFFYQGADTLIMLTEGEDSALDAQIDAERAKAIYNLTDLARMTKNWRLIDPKTGMEYYQLAGRA